LKNDGIGQEKLETDLMSMQKVSTAPPASPENPIAELVLVLLMLMSVAIFGLATHSLRITWFRGDRFGRMSSMAGTPLLVASIFR
jgi:hypothetical protein